MRKLTNIKKLMVHCARVNYGYMDLPAGNLRGYKSMVGLYRRIAEQSLICAQAMYEHKECPAHDPATSAFWWAIVPWAFAIGKDIGVDEDEWYEKFVAPHISFALYLRSTTVLDRWEPPMISFSPGESIIAHDIRWTKLVIKLTCKWGLWYHRKDIRAYFQTRRLMRELNRISTAWEAYLESDIRFLIRLFGPFDFSPDTDAKIKKWLREAMDSKIALYETKE